MFASELQRFAYDLGLDGKIIETFDDCYDNFDGLTMENKKIKTDRLIKMQHYYNVFSIGDEKFKIDIAGALTAEDFNKNHPEQKINLEDFYFSENINNNPFAKVSIKEDEIDNDKKTESQPE